jgi:uncharacterized membrane protein
MLYPILKWLHILAAITAVGSNITYGVWISRAARRPDMLPFTMGGIKQLDDRLANPAYGLLLITGLSMIFLVKMPLRTPWLLTALILYGLLVLIGLLGFTPNLKRQIQLLESQGPSSRAFQAAARRGTLLGILLVVLAVIIVFLMVVKPALWG